jgi:hypothetical protein
MGTNIGSITVHGRAAGSLSKRRFANVTKRWPLGGANEGNITPADGVEFDAGMFGARDTGNTLQLAVGAPLEQPLFILDDYDAFDVVEASQVPYLVGKNYTVETSALVTSITLGDVPPTTVMVVDSGDAGCLRLFSTGDALRSKWAVEESRMETLPSSTVPVLVVRVTPITV